jgi:hypothetical protein
VLTPSQIRFTHYANEIYRYEQSLAHYAQHHGERSHSLSFRLERRSRIDPPFGKERPLVLRKIVISPFPVIPDAGTYSQQLLLVCSTMLVELTIVSMGEDDAQRMGGWEPVIKVFTLKGHHKETNNERLLYSSDYHPTKLYYSKPGNIRVVRYRPRHTVKQLLRALLCLPSCLCARASTGRWTMER